MNINKTLRDNLCLGCGICESICTSGAISIDIKKGQFRPIVNESKCLAQKGCHRCIGVCPGLGINLEEYALNNFHDEGAKYNKMCGHYLCSYTGYSSNFDIRYHSASGGMVSQFLIWLLENEKIDGAIVTKFNKSNPLLVESFIAKTKDQIISARSSKYAPVSLHSALEELRSTKGQRFVVVGLPCHIHGIRKLMQVDRVIREKIIGLFAVYCSSGRSFYLTDYVLKERNIKQEDLDYFQYRDEGCLGKMVIKCKKRKGQEIKEINSYSEIEEEEDLCTYKELFQSFYHPLRSFFVPNRCLYCIDHYGELADVSFGDIHIKPYSDDKIGVNSIIVRKQYWRKLLEECKADNAVVLEEISFDTISKSQPMSFKKKGRNRNYLQIGKRLGLAVPQYDDNNQLSSPKVIDWLYFFQNQIQHYIGQHKLLWPIISLLKSKVNIH